MPNFYVVATPIGNLEDITLRALRVLKEADLILCEDTRVTRKLLNHYEIKTPTESYHAHSKLSKTDKIIKMLEDGKNIALVSDAGTPTISDPGTLLVSKIYEYFGDNVKIIPIPGASALVAALSVSGMPASEFIFLGFLPHKKGRETLFKEIVESRRTVVFYESTHRLIKALESLKEHLAGDRQIAVGKELTKMFEEIIRGNALEILKYLAENKDKIKGEFVVTVSPK